MALGERRAKAVQRYLVLQGVSPAQLELVLAVKSVRSLPATTSSPGLRTVASAEARSRYAQHLRVLTFLALSLPLAAWAEVPVSDGVAANNGGNVPPSGYGTAGAAVRFGRRWGDNPHLRAGRTVHAAPDAGRVGSPAWHARGQQNQIQQLKQESLNAPGPRPSDFRWCSCCTEFRTRWRHQRQWGACGSRRQQRTGAEQRAGRPGEGEALLRCGLRPKEQVISTRRAGRSMPLAQYPNSQYSGNASTGSARTWPRATCKVPGQAFARVSQSYPSSQKVPDSLYKRRTSSVAWVTMTAQGYPPAGHFSTQALRPLNWRSAISRTFADPFLDEQTRACRGFFSLESAPRGCMVSARLIFVPLHARPSEFRAPRQDTSRGVPSFTVTEADDLFSRHARG